MLNPGRERVAPAAQQQPLGLDSSDGEIQTFTQARIRWEIPPFAEPAHDLGALEVEGPLPGRQRAVIGYDNRGILGQARKRGLEHVTEPAPESANSSYKSDFCANLASGGGQGGLSLHCDVRFA